ncbi:uncharacterized protein SETTUDRAFT_19439 [Exserohilum turcica Et28A]|uniref:Phospholipid/glycerol acyltransferase domain-containing protein n=1 Tax=Exserohilum turcicum (strain 28A) TaxID=671987 RepID=R0IPR0_EXST2|nr:uncharacterized protein SETTUDRAFT_19439 [Exserohilum turcica Et28A]EOA86925.1 hypothetical protein SETTUDRAFT_19439 [Exserohilum turcica Et28A]
MAPSDNTHGSPASEQAPDLSITADDNVHLHAAGYNESPDRGLIHSFARFRSSPLDFLREVSLHFSGTGWRSFDNHIGQPEFYPGFSEEMKGRVLSSPMLLAKIRELADKRVDVEANEGLLPNDDRKSRRRAEIEESLLQVSEGWTDSMICKMESKTFIRGAYYFATQLLTRAYHQGVHVSSEEVLRLRAVAEKAQKDKHSIIFLPCHRSHVDYVSLQIICYRLGLALPTVVAGDNLNFPVVGSFLQHAGAMWIRRSFGDDQLYITLVQAYIDTLLRCGYNLECFVEGGRSRTGKLLPPKFGILSYMLDSVASGRVDDAIICPVSTQYDKVIEVDSYISELLGQPKPKENLVDFLSASSVLSLKLGRVDVRFHEPWSLKSFITQQRERFSKLPRQLSTKEERLRLLHTLGYKVLSEINDVSVVMPTALVGTVLLTLRGRGVGKTELIRRVEWLSNRVRAQGGRVAHFGNLPTSVVVDRALEVLGPGLVGLVPGLPEDTFYAVDRFQLSFYRNMTIHLFILQSLVSAALYMHVKQGGGPEYQSMSYTHLRAQVHFLSQLFRGEFIFPTEGLDTNLAKTLRGLEKDDVITLTRAESPASQEGAGGGEEEEEEEEEDEDDKFEWIQLSPTERAQGRENYDFYCFLIWPFIEAAWLGAISLMMLTPPPPPPSSSSSFSSPNNNNNTSPPWLDLKKTQDHAQLLGKTLYHQGDLSYFEAVNKETLKNAYTRFEQEGMIVVAKKRDAKGKSVPCIRLAEGWVPSRGGGGGGGVSESGNGNNTGIIPDGPLWRFAERISASRREGKNRRDGATVQTRVLKLVDLVGKRLWEGAVAGQDGHEEKESGADGAGAGAAEGAGAGAGGDEAKVKSMRKRGNMARL